MVGFSFNKEKLLTTIEAALASEIPFLSKRAMGGNKCDGLHRTYAKQTYISSEGLLLFNCFHGRKEGRVFNHKKAHYSLYANIFGFFTTTFIMSFLLPVSKQ